MSRFLIWSTWMEKTTESVPYVLRQTQIVDLLASMSFTFFLNLNCNLIPCFNFLSQQTYMFFNLFFVSLFNYISLCCFLTENKRCARRLTLYTYFEFWIFRKIYANLCETERKCLALLIGDSLCSFEICALLRLELVFHNL